MSRWLMTTMVVLALPAVCGASPSRAPAWAAVLDQHADATVDSVVGERGDALLALTGEPGRLHGVPVAGLRLTWLEADGDRRGIPDIPDLLGADLSTDGRLAAVTLQGGLLVGEPGALVPIDLGDRYVSQARWDPAGERLAITAWPEGVRPWDTSRARTLDEYREAADSDIYLVSPDRGTLRRLTTGSKQDYNPVWAPDGDRLLFVSLRTGYASLFLADVDSGRQHQLTNVGAERGAPAVPVPLSDRCTWDTVADRIAYETRDADGGAQVWVLDPAGDARQVGPFRALRTPGDGSAIALGASGWVILDLLDGEVAP